MLSLLDISEFSTTRSRHHQINTRDLEEAYEFISANVVPYTYKCLDKGWRSENQGLVHNYANLDNMENIYINYGREVLIEADPLDDYLLQIAHSGNCRLTCEGQEITLYKGQCGIISPGLPYRLEWSSDCSIFEVKFRRKFVEQVFESINGQLPDRPLTFELAVQPDHQFINYVFSSLSYMCALIENEKVMAHHRHSIKHLGLSVLTSILENQPNTCSLLRVKQLASSPKHLSRAIEYMRAHLPEPLTLTEIADIANTSVRNLTHLFQKNCDNSPMEYLKTLRLDCAHELLKKASPQDEQVTRIAMDCGFTHMGRFSSDYSKRFGRSPRESLKSPFV
ncbi:MAG: helix-turn-helix domain-containing protein [Gammaproteobacteria bacterium]|nr:helix-turn-helix domain-containing protein [Gammaproteobacteria bacterium]